MTKDFKIGEIVKVKKKKNTIDMVGIRNVTIGINQVGRITDIKKTNLYRERVIEVEMFFPNVVDPLVSYGYVIRRRYYFLRRELTDTTDEEKEDFIKKEQECDALEVAKKI
jgi:hypothetical protein